jgi:PAS domain S-box-containing protein
VSNALNHRSRSFSWAATIARALRLVFLLTSPALLAPLAAAQSNEPKRVLVLTEEDLSWPIFRLMDENLRATLRDGLGGRVQIFSEHLDVEHFPDLAIQAEQTAWIKKKYADSALDLIICVGDVQTDLFPGVPLVFISDDPLRKDPVSAPPALKIASVWVSLDTKKTLEVARRFQPQARHIVVIGDDASSTDTILRRLRTEISATAGDMQAIYLTNLSVAEIREKVSHLGTDSIVLFVTVTHDDHGHPLISADVVPEIAAASGAPVYTIFDTHLGTGAVGGYMTSFAEVGKAGGQLGLRILAGEAPPDIAVPNVYLFDWRQLQRWKISESALPANSVVLNRQPTLWETYSKYIIVGLLLFMVQMLLIVGLLWQRTKRKKAQQSAIDLMAFEKMLSKLSAMFINLPEGQVQATIENSLGGIADYLGLHRITLFDYSLEDKEFRMMISWCGEGVEPPPAVVDIDQLTSRRDALARGDTVLLSDINSLPDEALGERDHLKLVGTVSVATIPLMSGGKVFGGISFVSTTRRVNWTQDLVEELTLLAEIFSNALMRKRAQDDQFRYSAIVESSNDAIVSKNLDGIIVSWNTAAERLFGYSSAEATGRPITILVPSEMRDEESALLQRLRVGGRIEHYETVRIANGGKRVAVSLTMSQVIDSAGKTIGFSTIARDITDRKRAEQVLRESEERFRLVADTAPVLIWMSGTDKLCNFFNQGWLNFTGRSLKDELGEGWVADVYPDDVQRCVEIYSASFDARMDFEMEYRLRRFDGEYRWVVDYGVPRFESDGTFCGYIGSCVDITERKSSEESLKALAGRLIHAQEEERTRIARDLHDDFSQRLALQCIELEQVRKTLPESEIEARARLHVMLKGTKAMSSDLRSLSHQLHSSRLEFIGLLPALSGLCKEITEKYKIEVRFTGCELPMGIPKDVALCLFRVAQEALGNVIKHSQAAKANVDLRLKMNILNLNVTDSGKGFESEVGNSSAGIGLIGMTERLRLVGGKLTIRSEPMRGTEIQADVPLLAVVNEEQAKAVAAGAIRR